MTYFTILGALEGRNHNAELRFGGVMQQTFLAAMLASGGSRVAVDVLIDELWGPTPPAKVENALQAQASRMRRKLARLEPERAEPRLGTSVSGYRLVFDLAEVDGWEFVERIEDIRHRMEIGSGSLDLHIVELRCALSMWRGEVFGGVFGGPLCQAAAARLNEARNCARELLYRAEIDAGSHAKIIPELTGLVAVNADNEQFCGLLMLALYRSGRQIDALNTYRQFVRRLSDELGVEPSPILRSYEYQILTHAPILMGV